MPGWAELKVLGLFHPIGWEVPAPGARADPRGRGEGFWQPARASTAKPQHVKPSQHLVFMERSFPKNR